MPILLHVLVSQTYEITLFIKYIRQMGPLGIVVPVTMFTSKAIERLQECSVYMQVTLMMMRRYWTG